MRDSELLLVLNEMYTQTHTHTHTYIYIYIYHKMEYYSAIKKKKIMSFAATWMDLEVVILSEVSHREKVKYHMISFICGI